MQTTTNTKSIKLIALSLVIIGPLLAALQIQLGERAGMKAMAEREINEAELQLQQFNIVNDLTREHASDLLLLDFVVPLGARQDTLLTAMDDVAQRYGVRVTEFILDTNMPEIAELQLSIYRKNMEAFHVAFSGVTYNNLALLLDDLQNSSRPLQVVTWEFDSRQAKLIVNARVMFIENYAGN